ncbi:MAG: hypothetical protein NZ551_04230 [Microscillaceae bacterium]|nr:hypothetical protein [Microscillaceae bacterium]MDW8460398.1 hypothetical protein [Cytophagales bacterium]
MFNKIIIFLISFLVGLIACATAVGQCAMCKATLVNSVSDGQNIRAGINAGIAYLAIFPYLILALIAFLWYRQSQRNVKKRVLTIK